MKLQSSVAVPRFTMVPLFKTSRHRSPRVIKKLIKRHGGEFRPEVCIYRIGDTFFVHPDNLEAIMAAMS